MQDKDRVLHLDLGGATGQDQAVPVFDPATWRITILTILRLYARLRRWLLTMLFWSVAGLVCVASIYLWFAGAPALHEPVMEETLHDYLPDAERLLAEERYGEFFSVGRFVQENPDLPNHEKIVALYNATEAEYYGWSMRARRFFGGFVVGDTASTESMAGTVISDFLVIGDVRDLSIEGYHATTGQEVDYFVASLSAIGFLASAATIFPEPASTSAGVGAQGVLSMLKGLKRMKVLSPKVTDEILAISRRAADTRSLRPMMASLESTAAVAKHAPSGAIPAVMGQADSVADIRHLADWVRVAPDETVVAIARGGDGAIKTALKGGPSKAALTSLLRSTTRVVKPTVRGTKFFLRGRPAVVLQRLAEEAARKPVLRYAFLAGGTFLALLILRRLMLLGIRLIRRPKRAVANQTS